MNWDAIGALGNVGAAVAVALALVYLARQVRRNGSQLRLQTDHLQTSAAIDFASLLIGDEKLASLYRRGCDGVEDLSEDETYRFHVFLYLNFSTLEQRFEEFRSGILPRDQWEKWRGLLRWHLEQPGIVAWWRQLQQPLSRSFHEFVQGELAAVARQPVGRVAPGSQAPPPAFKPPWQD